MRIDSAGHMGIGDSNPSVALDVVGSINYTGSLTDVSDERLKENIAPVRNALTKLLGLRGVYFNMKDTPDQREVGLIAQNVQKVLPEAVSVIDQETGYLGVSYPSLIALVVEAITEMRSEEAARDAHQQKEINELRERVRSLESLVGLHTQMAAMQQQLAELTAREGR